jgi:peptidoglycan lytic transglycosylase
MNGSLRRIGMVLAALAAVVPATAVAQPPSGGATAPVAGPPSPFALSGGGSALLGHKVRFRGTVARRLAGRTVVVQSLDPTTQAWTPQARTAVAGDGSFLARWRARRTGQFQVRSVVSGAAHSAAVSPTLPLTVYRGAIATWYGPGFYGHTTACGIELTPDLVGVAHRSLPCGTRVAVHYGSRTLVVPVVDRGPFGSAARWDLTEAAAQGLGLTQTDRIGAVRVAG